jgi:hypothetical protein
MRAFSPHVSRGYADQQNSQPVNGQRVSDVGTVSVPYPRYRTGASRWGQNWSCDTGHARDSVLVPVGQNLSRKQRDQQQSCASARRVPHGDQAGTRIMAIPAMGSSISVDSAGELQTFLFQQFSLDTSPQSALAAPPPLALGLSLKSFLPLATHQHTERERLRVRQQSQCWVRARMCWRGQIPSDLVVNSQVADIIDLILQLIGHPNGVHRPCRNRKSRGAVLSTSEGQWATTKFDGV